MSLSIASDRKFGVEIEFTGITVRDAELALTNAGFRLENSGYYNHTDNADGAWKVVSDASVRGTGGAGEVVSPILSGVEGLKAVQKAADAINQAGATANKSCGLHVHVDARDLNGRDVANVVVRYGKFETEIDKVMPRSRRGADAPCAGECYCYGVESLATHFRDFPVNGTIPQAVRTFGSSRFRKVNLLAYNAHGSIEFRHHSGTVQSGKILPWIQFCVNFVETSRVNLVQTAEAAPTRRAGDSKTLVAMHKIVDMLDSRGWNGASKEDLAEVTGIKASSVVVYISNLRSQYGFEIKKSRGLYRLRRNGDLPALAGQVSPAAVPVGAPVPVVEVVENDTHLRGLPVSVVSYFSERASELAA